MYLWKRNTFLPSYTFKGDMDICYFCWGILLTFFRHETTSRSPWVFSNSGFYRQAPPVALSSDPPQPGRSSEPPQAVRKVWGKRGFRSKVRFFSQFGDSKKPGNLSNPLSFRVFFWGVFHVSEGYHFLQETTTIAKP